MKQLLYNLKTGAGMVADVPVPAAGRGRVLVRTAASLVSAGTERAAVVTARKSLVGKVRERPEAVGKVLGRMKDEGVVGTLRAVRDKLEEANVLGYSAAGTVMEVGADAGDFRVGDRVACAGLGYASHAEVLSVPRNLCARVPDGVDFESAAFSTLGAIALQGVRLAEPTIGESVVVIGLGLLGQLAVQLLRANGCRVFGVDLDASRVALARANGADAGATTDDDVKQKIMHWSRGRGADAVVITAATSSDEPVRLAGEVSRLRGRVVAVGGVGMNVPRDIYYVRELTLRVSMSYGPGRYDPEYEERGHDYPFAYVRWTEGRNIEAFLDLVASGSVNVRPLITHRFPIEEGERAYSLIAGESKEPYLGVVFLYDTSREVDRGLAIDARANAGAREATRRAPASKADRVRVGLIGAGDYARKMLLPHFKSEGCEFVSVATASGVTARNAGTQFGFARLASSGAEVVEDDGANLVVVATRNGTHARFAAQALARGRHVFVEKPLAMNDEELDEVTRVASRAAGTLTVGFNRRFSPLARACREFFAARSAPLSMVYRVNAGRIPREHWANDPLEGGGRIVAEVCHFVDLMQFFAGAPPTRVFAESIRAHNRHVVDEDSVFVTLHFADGSAGTIAYLAEGDARLAKERIEVFGEGKTFVVEDFRSATAYRGGREEKIAERRQDKGQAEEVRAVCAAVLAGGPAPVTLAELEAATRATFRIRDSLRAARPFTLDERPARDEDDGRQ